MLLAWVNFTADSEPKYFFPGLRQQEGGGFRGVVRAPRWSAQQRPSGQQPGRGEDGSIRYTALRREIRANNQSVHIWLYMNGIDRAFG